jgi:hypothetical protein
MRRTIMAILTLIALAAAATPGATRAQSGERCFPETGQCISGRIRQFWEQNGGLAVFGFPIGPQQTVTLEGKPVLAQSFERNRLELHPENTAPFDVLLGRLGADRLAQQGRDWFAFPKGGEQPGCRFFPETGHSICDDILAAWRASGLEIDGVPGKTDGESLALFGLPLSGLVTETLGDGKQYQVQWFERARFELHPENAPPYNVLLGLLGNELRDAAAAPAPTPAPAPEAPPAPQIQPAEVLDQYRRRMPAGLWQVNQGGIQISATGFEYRKEIGRFSKAGDGFKYVVFAIEVVNTGYNDGYSDSFYANPASFDLIDLDGQTHEADSATYGLDNYFKGGTFYQGTKSSGVLVYEIAERSAPAILIFGRGNDRVELDLRVPPK